MSRRFGPRSKNGTTEPTDTGLAGLMLVRPFKRGFERFPRIQTLMGNEEVELHVPGPEEDHLKLMIATLDQITKTDNVKQKVAYLGTLFCCFFPDIQNSVTKVFSEIGVKTKVIGSEQVRLEQGLLLDKELDYQLSLVYLGQACLIVYKQISINSYDNFMNKHTQALYPLAGMEAEGQTLNVLVNQTEAAKINRLLGSSYVFKNALLQHLMSSASGQDRSNTICKYVLDIIAWNEMSSITSIYDTLVLTRSPVLKVLEIRSEVLNLEHALREIAKTSFPEFFKILNPPYKTHVMERSRFPILTEVARQLKITVADTVKHFAAAREKQGSSNDQPQLVKELLAIHENYMKGRRLSSNKPLTDLQETTPRVLKRKLQPLPRLKRLRGDVEA